MSDGGAEPTPFKPNEEFLQELLSMGIEAEMAKEALYCTENESLEAAVNYIFRDGYGVRSDEEFKMVFVVNTALKMGTGKLAAQVGHACLNLYREMVRTKTRSKDLDYWEYFGEKKIVLKGDDDQHLLELERKAKEANIPCYLIRDAGRTQIPSGSITCLSLFELEKNVDKITGELALLK